MLFELMLGAEPTPETRYWDLTQQLDGQIQLYYVKETDPSVNTPFFRCDPKTKVVTITMDTRVDFKRAKLPKTLSLKFKTLTQPTLMLSGQTSKNTDEEQDTYTGTYDVSVRLASKSKELRDLLHVKGITLSAKGVPPQTWSLPDPKDKADAFIHACEAGRL